MVIFSILLSGLILIAIVILLIGKMVHVLSLIAFLIICLGLTAIAYISFAVGGVALVLFYEWLGKESLGWAFAFAATTTIFVVGLMLRGAVREMKNGLRKVMRCLRKQAKKTDSQVVKPR